MVKNRKGARRFAETRSWWKIERASVVLPIPPTPNIQIRGGSPSIAWIPCTNTSTMVSTSLLRPKKIWGFPRGAIRLWRRREVAGPGATAICSDYSLDSYKFQALDRHTV